MVKDQRVDVRIEGAVKAALQEFADKERRPLANYIAAVLADHVEAKKREAKRK